MDKINIELENCYGIRSLQYNFDFSRRKSYFVYAPNGSMKTSFAKTFEDISKKQNSKDRVHEHKETIRKVRNNNNQEVNHHEVFVINSYVENYKSEKIDTLLVNVALKQEYIAIYADINSKKDIIIKELEKSSEIKKGVDIIMSSDIIFEDNGEKFLTALKTLKYEVDELEDLKLSQVIYNKIFNTKTEELFKEKDFIAQLESYIVIYNQLIKNSVFFRNGVCDHDNASDICKNLIKNAFFKAEHAIFLAGDIQKITTEADLENKINTEKKQILENLELTKAFDKIASRLDKNEQCRQFRDYIKDKQFIIPELIYPQKFKRKLWITYLANNREAYNELITIYDENQSKLNNILKKINDEQPKWQIIVDAFNKRFFVPFKLDIENRADVIIGKKAPNLMFIYDDKPMKEVEINEILSKGEQRALYLLNIIFEIEARKELKQKTLFIVDDIADSFDYQNKYAIIEYLRDISLVDNFYLIILSHNYDFYRTVSNRLESNRGSKLYAVRSDNLGVNLYEEKYQNNPFHHWRENISNKENLIALIPFVRNIIEYCRGVDDDGYKKLTSLLHIKKDTDILTVNDLFNIIKKHITCSTNENNSKIQYTTRIVKDLIYETADEIIEYQEERMELERKIILSIAIRLKTEEHILTRINNTGNITKQQTFVLIDRYKEEFPDNIKDIKLFEEVRLITSENIHLNSFMYEPIIDISTVRLKLLYKNVNNLTKSLENHTHG